MRPFIAYKGRCLVLCALIPLFLCCGMPPRMDHHSPGSPIVQRVAVAKYNISLVAVEKGVENNPSQKQTVQRIFKEGNGEAFLFADGMIVVTWKPGPVAFGLKIANNTDSQVKLIWDDARFISPGGVTQRMLHSGFGYDERRQPQPPALITPGEALDDFLHPADNFKIYENGSDTRFSYWVRAPFLPDRAVETARRKKEKAPELRPGELADRLRIQAGQFIGKTCVVTFALEMNGSRANYISTFRIDDAKVTEEELKKPRGMEHPGDGRDMPPPRGRRLAADPAPLRHQ